MDGRLDVGAVACVLFGLGCLLSCFKWTGLMVLLFNVHTADFPEEWGDWLWCWAWRANGVECLGNGLAWYLSRQFDAGGASTSVHCCSGNMTLCSQAQTFMSYVIGVCFCYCQAFSSIEGCRPRRWQVASAVRWMHQAHAYHVPQVSACPCWPEWIQHAVSTCSCVCSLLVEYSNIRFHACLHFVLSILKTTLLVSHSALHALLQLLS